MQVNNFPRYFSILLAIHAVRANGVDLLTDRDVSLGMGGMFGTVESPEVNRGRPVPFGGAIVGVGFFRDFGASYTGYLEPQIAFDGTTQSVSRKGINIGLCWHLFGGARRMTQMLPGILLEEENHGNFSLLFRSGYFSFSAQPSAQGANPLVGAVVESGVGIEYRHDLFATSAIGMRFIKSMMTFSTSVENLKTDYAEITVFWRKII